nr:MAG TPA: hypothetical protein [Caudoviricetes sp.]
MENEGMDFEEFFSAYDAPGEDDGNQTDPETVEEETGESTQEAEESPETGEESSEGSTPEQEKKPDEGNPEVAPEPQKFTIKVNKGTREVELPEMTELAQKGADYDRVKGQLETSRTNEANLQKTVDEQSPIMEVLQLAAKDAGVDVAELVDSIHVGLLKGKGMTEAEARAEIRAAKAEKAVNDLKNKPAQEEKPETDSNQERAKREIAEFQTAFPGVQLNQETLDKLAPDVQNGMTLTSAYLKMENARLTSELAEQKRALEAEKQNQKNRRQAAPGQNDSGGGREKDAFEDFFTAFEK